MSILLTLLLGTALAWGNRRRCTEGDDAVAATQQDQDLIDALAPFTVAATDGEDGSDAGSDGGEDVSALFSVASDSAPTSTTCRFRGLSRKWPHEYAEPEEVAEVAGRRLLRRGGGGHWRRSKHQFEVDSQVFSPVQKKKRRNNYECFNDGTVRLEFKSVEYHLSTDEADDTTNQDGGPRRELHGYDPTETTPYAILTLEQTNAFEDDNGDVIPVSFDITLTCKPLYKYESETCELKGFNCWNGSYTYFFDDSSEEDQQTKTKEGFGLKCAHADGYFDNWSECAFV